MIPFKIKPFWIILLLAQNTFAAETLQEIFTVAISNNQRILEAKKNTQASKQQVFAAQGQRLPQINVRGGYTQLSNTPSAQTTVGGQPAQFAMSQAGSANAQAIISMPVFTSWRITHDIEAAEASNRATAQNEITTELMIKQQVSQAFINIFRSQKALEVAQTHVTSLKAHAQDVQNLYQQGMVARNDLLASEVSLSHAEQTVLQIENRLNIAQARFNQLLNRELTETVDLAEEFPTIQQGDFSELKIEALAKRPELVALAEQIHVFKEQAASINASLLPQVNINGGYQYTQNRYQTYQGMWTANATVNWTIYNGSTSHRSDALMHQANALSAQRNDLINVITLQVRQAWLDLKEAQKRVQITAKAIDQADENLKVSNQRYQQGLAAHTEVLDAEDLRTQAYDNFNNARYDVAMANLNLRRALGTL